MIMSQILRSVIPGNHFYIVLTPSQGYLGRWTTCQCQCFRKSRPFQSLEGRLQQYWDSDTIRFESFSTGQAVGRFHHLPIHNCYKAATESSIFYHSFRCWGRSFCVRYKCYHLHCGRAKLHRKPAYLYESGSLSRNT